MRIRVFHDPRPTSWPGVYRLYDTDDRLLYVGVGVRPTDRVRTHSHRQDWGCEIATAVIDWWPTYEAAQRAERQAIRLEQPVRNVVRYATS